MEVELHDTAEAFFRDLYSVGDNDLCIWNEMSNFAANFQHDTFSAK